MFAQQAALTAYARAAVLFERSRLSRRGRPHLRLPEVQLAGPGGGFYASMGMAEGQPGVDKRQYARETGQAIQGLAAYYDATGNKEALTLAIAGADWALRERALTGGGFRHTDAGRRRALSRRHGRDGRGPAGAASLDRRAQVAAGGDGGGQLHRRDLHRSQDRRLLRLGLARCASTCPSRSSSARTMSRPRASSPCSPSIPARRAIARSPRPAWATSPRRRSSRPTAFLPDVLLAEEELRNEPVHVTVVGAKDDPRSAALYAGALAYPLAYKRAEWWDKRRGQAHQPRRRLSGLSRRPGRLRLHAQFLLAAGDRRRGDPGADSTGCSAA